MAEIEDDKELFITELFAFLLCAACEAVPEYGHQIEDGRDVARTLEDVFHGTAREKTLDQMRLKWQQSPELRNKYRQLAVKLNASLLQLHGLSVRSGDIRKVCSTVEWVRTIPEKKAYDLAQELNPK